MTKEELRIGNYVLGQTKQITKVDGFFNENKAIYTYVEDERVRFIIHYLNECEGVPLTEKILLKCGFEQKDHLFRLYLVNSIYIEFNSEYNLWYFDIYMNTSRVELQYLHELQNIYQSITFKELKIEL